MSIDVRELIHRAAGAPHSGVLLLAATIRAARASGDEGTARTLAYALLGLAVENSIVDPSFSECIAWLLSDGGSNHIIAMRVALYARMMGDVELEKAAMLRASQT